MTSRREYVAVLVLLVGAGVLALVASGATWQELPPRSPLPVAPEAVSGARAAPEVGAAALVALAASLAVLATGRRGRLLIGLLVATGGIAATVGAAGGLATATTAWPAVATGSALLLVLAGSLVAVRGGRWPTMGTRYQPSARRAEGTRSTWDALDRGEDPTV
jgi:Tryptophan-associated transmembrane protein (Trp_oprn_chp)